LSHIAEDISLIATVSFSFSSFYSFNFLIFLIYNFLVDGVPKEGLRIQDVLVRIAVLLLIRDKVSPE
jgi:hypothetical protein